MYRNFFTTGLFFRLISYDATICILPHYLLSFLLHSIRFLVSYSLFICLKRFPQYWLDTLFVTFLSIKFIIIITPSSFHRKYGKIFLWYRNGVVVFALFSRKQLAQNVPSNFTRDLDVFLLNECFFLSSVV